MTYNGAAKQRVIQMTNIEKKNNETSQKLITAYKSNLTFASAWFVSPLWGESTISHPVSVYGTDAGVISSGNAWDRRVPSKPGRSKRGT